MANNLHMGGRQLQIERAKLRDEAAVLRELKETYTRAGKDIAEKIRIRNGRINVLLKDIDNLDDKTRSILQAQIYQRDFQIGLKRQIDAFMDVLNNGNSKTMNEYLANCYKNGFIGSVFDMQGQGVPLAMPIDPKKLAQASVLTPKLSRKLYGQYAGDVKQAARMEISRGIATASAYAEIARNIDAQVQVGYNKAARIARTEGHRIQAESAFDAQLAARDAGADVVKQWDAALDGRTRETHMKLDGQIRELDEPFEVDGMTAMYPSDFGNPAEDINCRCALTQRARWALDDDETKQLQNVEDMSDERKQMLADKLGITPAELEKYSGQTIPIKASNYADFRKKYNKIWNYEPVEALRGRAATVANSAAAAAAKGLLRKATNKGAFERLPERMSKKHIREVAAEFGIELKGFTIQIDNSVELLDSGFFGMSPAENVGTIIFFPDAFASKEELVRTIIHEKEHYLQYRKYGVEYVLENIRRFEKEAKAKENRFINALKKEGKI